MLNQVILVGRIIEIIKNQIINDKKINVLVLGVSRTYKNDNGEYETDFIECVLNDNIFKNSMEYLKLLDMVGIKGNLETIKIEENDKTKNEIKVIVEKITFLKGSNTK